MKIKIDPVVVANCIESENYLFDEGTMIEAIYAIRMLRAAILLNGKDIEVGELNSYEQAYISTFEIWISKGCYKIV